MRRLAERIRATARRIPLLRALVLRARRLPRGIRHQRARLARRVRDLARRVGRRLAPDWVRQVIGDRPRRLLRLSTIALMVGDHRAAQLLTAPRHGFTDEHDLTVALIAEWEMGERRSAREDAERQLALAGAARRRAVARFYLYLEEAAAAERSLPAVLGEPEFNLALEVAQAWRRSGHPEEAIALIERALGVRPKSQRAAYLRAAAEGELSLAERVRPRSARELRPAQRNGGRILHLVARSLPQHRAGATYRTHYLVRAQRSLGLDAQVVTECGFAGGRGIVLEEHEGVPYHRLHGQPVDHRLDTRIDHHVDRASRLVEELRPAVLHAASDYRNATVAIELGERFDLPVVYEVRGFPEEYLRRRPGSRLNRDAWVTRRGIETDCWRRADRIVTLAEVMKDHIASKGVARDRIRVVPNAVDTDLFRPVPRSRELAARLGIQARETAIGYITSFYPYEGIRYLIEATAHLHGEGRAVKLILVGDGPDRDYLGHLARRLGVGDQVIFTGRVDHAAIRAYYALIDIFVVPRTREATTELVTPLKPFEAMAMARPVVVSGTAALSELIVEGETGRRFEPENASSLAQVIRELIDDPRLREQLGETGREWVLGNRTWAQNAEVYRELYEEIR